MLTLIAIAVAAYTTYLKRHVAVYILAYSFPLIAFSIAIDGHFVGLWDYMFVNDTIQVGLKSLYYWLVMIVSHLVFTYFLQSNPINSTHNYNFGIKHIRRLAFFLAGIATMAFTYNIRGAGSLNLLLLDTRAWELAFGRSTFANYMYFLHLPALVLLGICVSRRENSIMVVACSLLMLTISLFHGIKFTIIHAFIFFALAVAVGDKERINSKVILILVTLVTLLILFFIFVRGGGVIGFLGYITSSSVNSLYVIETSPLYFISDISIFNPLNILPLDKLGVDGAMLSLNDEQKVGFLLNDSFNLQNQASLMGYGFGIGLICLSIFYATVLNLLRKKRFDNFSFIYLRVFIVHSMFFGFTAIEIYKFKLWFGFFTLWILYNIFSASKNRVTTT